MATLVLKPIGQRLLVTRRVENGPRQRVSGHFPGFDGSQLKSQVEGLRSISQAPTRVPPGDSIPARRQPVVCYLLILPMIISGNDTATSEGESES